MFAMAADSRISRRAFAIGAGCTLLAVVAPQIALANADRLGDLVKMLFGDGRFEEGTITLDVPEMVENGMVVPITVEVESPMTDTHYVRAIYLYALDNPVPQIGAYTFTPASGKAAISTRVRLAKSQDVIAVAEMSDGSVRAAKAPISIMIGGCG
jgi:sulfur-oxidizing protein SoxY